MKRILASLIIGVSISSLLSAEETNRQARIQKEIRDERTYRDELREMGLHVYADTIGTGVINPAPSLVSQARAAMKFEEFLIDNWGNKKKIDEYLYTHGSEHTQLYWLLRLRLAEHYWMRGAKKKAQAIIDAYAVYLKESQESVDQNSLIRRDQLMKVHRRMKESELYKLLGPPLGTTTGDVPSIVYKSENGATLFFEMKGGKVDAVKAENNGVVKPFKWEGF